MLFACGCKLQSFLTNKQTNKLMTTSYTFKISPRPVSLGGGWRLYLLEDGQEVGGGVFPAESYEGIADDPEALDWAYQDALSEAQAWMLSRAV